MRLFIQAISAISRGLGLVAGLLLFSAVLSVSHMVFVRSVLGHSTVWQTEYTAYAIVAATFLGAPWVLIQRGHVNVDLLQLAAPAPMRLVLQILSALASLLFVGLLAYAGWYHFEEAWTNGWTSDTVWAVPLWMPLLPMPVGTVMLALQYVAEIMRLILDGADDVGHEPALMSDSRREARP
ncbi:TRAP transporter small permease [Jiella sp. MQZ9-1]|uniref:TRAP transporter small permease protein n=1 Tax=Jiella flava TaxID=2816857 RepID=A0A939JXI8_9HYPH|nr:TRAP transporter small permease [Jiella flava]MBO0663411.1 TRAP transporter small permease [Jiella flava]MCD2471987.1 TRAP transporter small permease [Jiella flava]